MAHLNYSGKVVLRRSLSSLSAPEILMKWLSLLSNSLSPDDNLFISWIESAPTLHLSRGNRSYQGQVIKISIRRCNDDFCLWLSSLSNHTLITQTACVCQNLISQKSTRQHGCFFLNIFGILWLSPNLIFRRYGVHPFKDKGIDHGHYETYKHEDIMPMDDH